MDVTETKVQDVMTQVEGLCSDIESSSLMTDTVECVCEHRNTDNVIHKKDKIILTNASGTVSYVPSICEGPAAVFPSDFDISPHLQCQEGKHEKAVSQGKKKTLRRSNIGDEGPSNRLSETDHQELCCYITGGQASESEHSMMDNIVVNKFNKVSCLLCNKNLPSISSVEENIQGPRHKTAYVALCRSQMKDSAFVGSEERLLVGQNSGETGYQDGQVQEELQHTVRLSLPSSIHMCKKEFHTPCAVDIKKQLEESNSLCQVQQETCVGEKGGKPHFETPEFQSIVSLDGDSFLCNVCDIILPTYICVEQHIMGKEHTKNLATKAVDIERMWKMVRELEGGRTGNIYMTSVNRFKCKLCHKNIHASYVISHVRGKTHQQKLKGVKETNRKHANRSQKWKPHNVHSIWNEIYTAENGKWSNIKCTSPETFHCEPCKSVLSVHDVLAHVRAASHQQAIRAPEIIQMNESLMRIAHILWEQMNDADRTHQTYFKIDNNTILYCTSCCVRIPATVSNLTDHIRGKTHMSTVVKNMLSKHPSIMEQTSGSVEENSQILKATQTQNLAKGRLQEKSKCHASESFSNLKGSQPQIKSVVYSAQEALVKALLPKEKGSAEQSAAKHKGKSVTFHCVICDNEIESEELWYQHKRSQEHNLETSKLVAEGKNPITSNCSICGATVYCIESDLAKHTCQKVWNEGRLSMFSEMAGNAEQVNKRTATELCHQEDTNDEEQVNKPAHVPRIVVSGKNNTCMYKCSVKLGICRY